MQTVATVLGNKLVALRGDIRETVLGTHCGEVRDVAFPSPPLIMPRLTISTNIGRSRGYHEQWRISFERSFCLTPRERRIDHD